MKYLSPHPYVHYMISVVSFLHTFHDSLHTYVHVRQCTYPLISYQVIWQYLHFITMHTLCIIYCTTPFHVIMKCLPLRCSSSPLKGEARLIIVSLHLVRCLMSMHAEFVCMSILICIAIFQAIIMFASSCSSI